MTLQWLTLLILVPLVLIPTVLYLGFSGCQLVFGVTDIQDRHIEASAEALGVSSIRISWTFDEAGPTTYEVRRTQSGETTLTPLLRTLAKTHDDTHLEEVTTYFYQVVAIESDYSETLSGRVSATTFAKTFEAVLEAERIWERRTIVQRIEPIRLSRSGTRVIVTVERPSVGALFINAATISRLVGGAYASAPDITSLIDSPVKIVAPDPGYPSSFQLGPVDYALDPTQSLLIAFDILVPGNVPETSTVSAYETVAYVGPLDVFEAAQTTRTAGYSVEAAIYLIRRIDVV